MYQSINHMNPMIRPLLHRELGTPFLKSHPRYGKGVHPVPNHQQAIQIQPSKLPLEITIHESIPHMIPMIVSLLLGDGSTAPQIRDIRLSHVSRIQPSIKLIKDFGILPAF